MDSHDHIHSVYSRIASSVTAINTSWIDCTVSGSVISAGDVPYGTTSSLDLTNCAFTNNVAGNALIYLHSLAELEDILLDAVCDNDTEYAHTITSTAFTNNSADYLLYGYRTNIDLHGSTSTDDDCSVFCLYLFDSASHIDDAFIDSDPYSPFQSESYNFMRIETYEEIPVSTAPTTSPTTGAPSADPTMQGKGVDATTTSSGDFCCECIYPTHTGGGCAADRACEDYVCNEAVGGSNSADKNFTECCTSEWDNDCAFAAAAVCRECQDLF